jgi:hypothetical protein
MVDVRTAGVSDGSDAAGCSPLEDRGPPLQGRLAVRPDVERYEADSIGEEVLEKDDLPALAEVGVDVGQPSTRQALGPLDERVEHVAILDRRG